MTEPLDREEKDFVSKLVKPNHNLSLRSCYACVQMYESWLWTEEKEEGQVWFDVFSC